MKVFFGLASLLLSAQSFAQSTLDLNPITVTSTRTEQKANETGRNITVIDGKLFNKLPVQSIDELLKYVPGVEVQSRGPLGSQSDIVIRGGTFQQVLVLLDGVKVNDPITGHFSSYIPIAPYEIERIEILKGPAAAVYGAEAVGGVINVITKTFNQFKKEKRHEASYGLTAGQYETINTNAGWHTTGAKINAVIGVLSNNTSGQLLRGNNRGFAHNNTISGSAAIQLKNNWQLNLRSSYDSRDFAAQNFYTIYKSDTATEKVTTWWNQAQLKQQSKKHSQQFDVLYKYTQDHYLYNPISIANDNKSKYVVLQYTYSLLVNNNWQLNAGAQLDNRAILSNDRGNHETTHGALYGTALYSIANLKLAGALRVDRDKNYGTALSPQLNASYHIKQFTFSANVGKSIRSADFTERYNNYNKVLVKSGSIGNPNLTTENGWSYEVGAEAILSNQFKLSVNGFYRDQNNVIDYTSTPYADMPRKDNLIPAGTYALAKNIKTVQTRGIELQLTYQKALAQHQSIYINGGLTFLNSSSSDAVPSFYIISHAKILAQANVLYQIKKLHVTVSLLYKERNTTAAAAINAAITKNYFLLNTKTSFDISKRFNVFLSCNNLTNIKYSDLLGSIMPERWLTGGLQIQL